MELKARAVNDERWLYSGTALGISCALLQDTEQAESLQLLPFLTLHLKGHLPQNLVMWEGRVGYESCEKSFPKWLLVFRIRSKTRCIRPKILPSDLKYLALSNWVASSCVLCCCQVIKDHLPFNFLHKISPGCLKSLTELSKWFGTAGMRNFKFFWCFKSTNAALWVPVFVWDVNRPSLKCLCKILWALRLRKGLKHVAVGLFLFVAEV